MTSNTKKARGKITKIEAVRRALAELGKDAKPLQLQAWIKEKLGIEMSADHVSVCKGTILRKARGKRKVVAVPQASAARNQEPQVHRAPVPRGGISLDDIEAVKGLVGRIGPDSLKKLVDVLGR
ncbi:MAG TPA: hypothetical protein VG013_26260 [Gemmataceae bacterium]|jgi:hypothetical protein|nr:hypothetical protein [Gemmataceae bacterium]